MPFRTKNLELSTLRIEQSVSTKIKNQKILSGSLSPQTKLTNVISSKTCLKKRTLASLATAFALNKLLA